LKVKNIEIKKTSANIGILIVPSMINQSYSQHGNVEKMIRACFM